MVSILKTSTINQHKYIESENFGIQPNGLFADAFYLVQQTQHT